jgi:biotin-dependent carboxylase-like uncharacterized protein
MTGALEVVSAAGQVLVEDRGRAGWEHYGVAVSGAADRTSLDLANRLVGNHPEAAGLEVLMGGLRCRAHAAMVVSVCGARCPVAVRRGPGGGARPVAMDQAVTLDAGDELEIGPATTGLRVYIAIAGGVDVPEVLGSRATDTMGSIGPPPARAGDVLPIGAPPVRMPWFEVVPVAEIESSLTVPMVLGPRADWLDRGGALQLSDTWWTVSADSDRIGVRLQGAALGASHGDSLGRRPGDVPTEPVMPGAVQVPADGQPIVLGRDAGVTGGYPVVGVVSDESLDRIAQLRPGDQLRLRPVR